MMTERPNVQYLAPRGILTCVAPGDPDPAVVVRHATAIASSFGADLNVLVVGSGRGRNGQRAVRHIIEPLTAGRACTYVLDVAEDGSTEDVVRTIESADPDMLVLGTQGRTGAGRLVHPSIAEAIQRRTGLATLFLRQGVAGLLNDQGQLSVRTVLFPFELGGRCQGAFEAAGRFVLSLGGKNASFQCLHVGSKRPDAYLSLPLDVHFGWHVEYRRGEVVDTILEVARELSPDLIVMATHGHDSFGDFFAGSKTEQVVRAAPCPVLALPHR